MSKELRGSLILLAGSLIWGTTFVSQSVGMDYVGPITFMFARSFLTVLFLIGLMLVTDGFKKKNNTYKKMSRNDFKHLLEGGIITGIFLAAASNVQQIGIAHTTVGKSGFLTAMYMIFVPITGIFIGKKTTLNVWISVVIATIGVYFLSVNEKLTINFGDAMCLLCAVFYTFQILSVAKYSKDTDGIKLSLAQFVTCLIISTVLMFIFEKPVLSDMLKAWFPIAYAGIMSGGIAYTFQIIGQRDTHPAVASLCMSFECFFAALSGAIILKQIPNQRELLGLSLMFAGIIYSQIPAKGLFLNKKSSKDN